MLLLGYFSIASANAVVVTKTDCKLHPLYCKMLELQPKVNRKWAMRFSNLLLKYGKQYHMDPWRSLAIAMQETSLRNIHRAHTIIIFGQTCHSIKIKQKKGYRYQKKCRPSYHLVKGYSDLTIFQFHLHTILAHHLDPLKLHTDLAYAVKSHYELLKLKIKRCENLGKDAWSCYHSKTPFRRERYVKLVNRYYFPHPVKDKSTLKKKA